MAPIPHFGVTGFTTPAEVDNVLDSYMTPAFGNPLHGGRKLMVGVLVNEETLNGKPSSVWPERYPPVERVASIFEAAVKKTQHGSNEFWPERGLGPVYDLRPRTLRFIHFHTYQPQLPAQLDRLLDIGGAYLNGIQLNIVNPPPHELRTWKKHHAARKLRLVIQVNRLMFRSYGNDPKTLCDALHKLYAGVMTDILFDLSGGEGVALDLQETTAAVEMLFARFGKTCGIGVAGGLNHGSVVSLAPLFKRFPTLSTDAESRIRDVFMDHEDKKRIVASSLSELARYYLRNAFGILPITKRPD